MEMFEEWFLLDEVEQGIFDLLDCKEKVMGFGYVVYKESDLCNVIIKQWLKLLVEEVGDIVFYFVLECVEEVMWCEKKFFVNVDFFYVLVYCFFGILMLFFMLIFVMVCIVGWFVYVFE